MLRFVYHLVFIFIVYNVINRHKTPLSYSLLIKFSLQDKTKNLIIELTYT